MPAFSQPRIGLWPLRLVLLGIGFGLVGSGALAWFDPLRDALWNAAPASAWHQLRAIHGMYIGLGIVAMVGATQTTPAPALLRILALVLALAAVGRLLSFALDGPLPLLAWSYCAIESACALFFAFSARRPPGSPRR